MEMMFIVVPVHNSDSTTPISAVGTVPRISSGCVRLSSMAASSM